ncbi:alpha/beta fold hydrolase [Laceyella putida]|uniref:Alpha/beta fold hydrolase n=1 Tax=Laceyella putida TaxID=110101 RepID=A0ABW2RK59_9BACL
MKKSFASLSVVFILLVAMLMPQATSHGGSIFPIVIGIPGTPGSVYIGDAPAHPDPNKPVVVFVQGLYNSASIWYILNDMYQRTRDAGFETAFVELHDAGGTPRSNWANGNMLADQLQQISDHFHGKKLVVVGYSKGGIDTQTALVHYGKHPLVSNVITIGTPHYGSPLADLAYSDWVWWLSSLIGTRNEAVYSLQTGVMNSFRAQTDNMPEINENAYFSISGNSWGPFLSPTWFGGVYMNVESDGVVPLHSTILPYGKHLRTGNWHHLSIFQGSPTFEVFKPYLTTERLPTAAAAKQEDAPPIPSANDVYLTGGEQDGSKEEAFPVEPGATRITLNWMSSQPLSRIELIRPDGQVQPAQFQVSQDTDTIFKGSWQHIVQIDQPQAGTWKIRTSTSHKAAYALIVTFDSPLSAQLHLQQSRPYAPDFQLTTTGTGKRPNLIKEIRTEAQIQLIPDPQSNNKRERVILRKRSPIHPGSIRIPATKGTYNMTINIRGVTATGSPFARTIVKSFVVDKQGRVYGGQ